MLFKLAYAMINIILFLFLPFFYYRLLQNAFPDLLIKRTYEIDHYPTLNIITKVIPPKESNQNQVSVVYMTCFNDYFNDTRFNLPTYHLSCKHRESDECHEAVPYLRFIYDHYEDLEGKIFFFMVMNIHGIIHKVFFN